MAETNECEAEVRYEMLKPKPVILMLLAVGCRREVQIPNITSFDAKVEKENKW